MTSGKRTLERRALLAAAVGAAFAPAFGAGFDIAALMALLAARKSGEARFTEEREVAGFDGPVRSSGTLSFVAPDRFTKATLEPRAESMEVDGNQVVLRRGGRTRQVSVDSIPELGVLVDAVRGTLAGDAKTLERRFRVELGGSAAKWLLALTPKDARLARQLRSIEIAGQNGDLRSVEVRMTGGDRSLMLIEPVPNR
jgi:hypothetical protein